MLTYYDENTPEEWQPRHFEPTEYDDAKFASEDLFDCVSGGNLPARLVSTRHC